MKRMSALFTVVALIAGSILIIHGSSYAGVFNLPNLSLIQARQIYAGGLFQIVIGVGVLVIAAGCYRFYSQQY
jgi:hypothetical protein